GGDRGAGDGAARRRVPPAGCGGDGARAGAFVRPYDPGTHAGRARHGAGRIRLARRRKLAFADRAEALVFSGSVRRLDVSRLDIDGFELRIVVERGERVLAADAGLLEAAEGKFR